MQQPSGNLQWRSLTIVYKFMILSTICSIAVQFYLPQLTQRLISTPLFGYLLHSYWGVFFNMYFVAFQPGYLLNIFFALMWFRNIIPRMEKQYSSLYVFIDIFMQNLMIQSLFLLVVIGGVQLKIFGEVQLFLNASYGWWTILLVYIFRQGQVDPQKKIWFCCIPCCIPQLIKQKYMPWIILSIIVIFNNQVRISFCCAGFLGFVQAYGFRGKNIIRLPLIFYRKVDNLISNFIKKRSDYVEVEDTLQLLKTMSSCSKDRRQFNQQRPQTQKVVKIVGQGVMVGTNSKNEVLNGQNVCLKESYNLQVEPNPFQQKNNRQSQKFQSTGQHSHYSGQKNQFQFQNSSNESFNRRKIFKSLLQIHN